MNIGSPGSEDRKKFLAICGFAVLAAGLLYYELYTPDAPAAPHAAPVVTTAPSPGSPAPRAASGASTAKAIGTTAAALDPTLHMEPMRITESVIYEGAGRNIFSAVSAPVVVIPKPIVPARPLVAQVQAPPPPPGPPPPPPIDLKFCGYFATPSSGSEHQVILVHGDDVVLAHAGDIVLRRYRVLSVSASSIQVEDLVNNNKQVLPLTN